MNKYLIQKQLQNESEASKFFNQVLVSHFRVTSSSVHSVGKRGVEFDSERDAHNPLP